MNTTLRYLIFTLAQYFDTCSSF